MYLALITLPLLGSIATGLFGRKIGISGAQLIASTSLIVTTILAIFAFIEVGLNNIPVSINIIRWVDSESLNILWGFHFDSLTVSMLIPVLIISSLVHIYSVGYMSHDPHPQRFFSYLSLFTFMMILLVTANNYLLMFVGWEGVGVCSYLLVNFWFTRIAANQSSISAFLTNRVGDSFLTLGMFALLWCFGNIDYTTVFSLAPFVNEDVVTIVGICLVIGAMAKSSQIGLHIWLPLAMEGPTPVSALIHAATMVTAGVYLLMRSSPLIEYSSTVLLVCLWLGAITTVFSSLIGLFQQDIKKVIAYSTMSQLGMMVIAIGLSSYNVALFHLFNHAFYKALLFLAAGSVIHAVSDNQDFRKFGGLRAYLPLTYSVMLIASLSLVAFPFMTGFYSKDFILESAYGLFYFSGIVVYYIATVGAIFTTLYSVKVLYLTFLSSPNGNWHHYKHKVLEIYIYNIKKLNYSKKLKEFALNLPSKIEIKDIVSYFKLIKLPFAEENNLFMNLPLIILAIFSIFLGYTTKDIFIGLGSAIFTDNSLFMHSIHEIMLDTEFAVSTFFKLLPLIFTISLSLLAIFISEFYPIIISYFKLSRLGYNIYVLLNLRFFIEFLYNKYISGLFYYKLGGQTTMVIDKGSVELLGPYGSEKSLITISKNISNMSTGLITNYALYILMGLLSYVSLYSLIMYGHSLLVVLLLALLGNVNNIEFKLINDKRRSNLSNSFVIVLLLITILIFIQSIFLLYIKKKHYSNFLIDKNIDITQSAKKHYFSWKNLTKYFTLKNLSKFFTLNTLLTAIITFLIIFTIRFFITPIILELLGFSFSKMELWFISGILACPIRLMLKGVLQHILDDFFHFIKIDKNLCLFKKDTFKLLFDGLMLLFKNEEQLLTGKGYSEDKLSKPKPKLDKHVTMMNNGDNQTPSTSNPTWTGDGKTVPIPSESDDSFYREFGEFVHPIPSDTEIDKQNTEIDKQNTEIDKQNTVKTNPKRTWSDRTKDMREKDPKKYEEYRAKRNKYMSEHRRKMREDPQKREELNAKHNKYMSERNKKMKEDPQKREELNAKQREYDAKARETMKKDTQKYKEYNAKKREEYWTKRRKVLIENSEKE